MSPFYLVPLVACRCIKCSNCIAPLLQVNLSQCTNPVTANLQPLCPQNAYIGMDPEDVYQINLCCGNCSFQVKKKRLAAILGGAAGGLVALISLWIGVMLFLRYRTRQSALKEIREGIPVYIFHGWRWSLKLLYVCQNINSLFGFHFAQCVSFNNIQDGNWTEFARESIATYLYKYRELKAATHGFNMKNKLGEGGFGDVYLVRSLTLIKRKVYWNTLAIILTIERTSSCRTHFGGFTSWNLSKWFGWFVARLSRESAKMVHRWQWKGFPHIQLRGRTSS